MLNIPVIALFLIVAGAFIFLQFKLCNAENGKKLGLILPAISCVAAVACTVGVVAYSGVKMSSGVVSYDDYGNVISTETVDVETDGSSLVSAAAGCFVYTNIPTIFFVLEYAIIMSNKKKAQTEADELNKTQIQDL